MKVYLASPWFNDKERVCHFKLAFDKTFESSYDNDYYFHNYTQDELDARDKRRLFGMKKIPSEI